MDSACCLHMFRSLGSGAQPAACEHQGSWIAGQLLLHPTYKLSIARSANTQIPAWRCMRSAHCKHVFFASVLLHMANESVLSRLEQWYVGHSGPHCTFLTAGSHYWVTAEVERLVMDRFFPRLPHIQRCRVSATPPCMWMTESACAASDMFPGSLIPLPTKKVHEMLINTNTTIPLPSAQLGH